MPKGIDVGTAFVVGAELREGREIFTSERHAFFSLPAAEAGEDMLTNAGAFTITRGDQIFVIGDDALRFSHLAGISHGDREGLCRPMKHGALSMADPDHVAMTHVLVEGIIGPACVPGEICVATSPADPPPEPLGAGIDLAGHRLLLTRILESLGYEVTIVSKGLGVILAGNPTMELPGHPAGRTLPFTGIGIGFGAGMVHVAGAFRGKETFAFSVPRGGDWLDAQVAKVTASTPSRVAAVKEKQLDFTATATNSGIAHALDFYFDEWIGQVIAQLAAEWQRRDLAFEAPIEIVLGGGGAAVPGFAGKVETILRKTDFPLDVRGVRTVTDPEHAAAAGALIAAISKEKKRVPRETA